MRKSIHFHTVYECLDRFWMNTSVLKLGSGTRSEECMCFSVEFKHPQSLSSFPCSTVALIENIGEKKPSVIISDSPR